MKIKISANGHTLYFAELVTLFRCEQIRGLAAPAPAVDELRVELELGELDRLVDVCGLDLASQGGRGRRLLEISTPARLPTDRLDD